MSACRWYEITGLQRLRKSFSSLLGSGGHHPSLWLLHEASPPGLVKTAPCSPHYLGHHYQHQHPPQAHDINHQPAAAGAFFEEGAFLEHSSCIQEPSRYANQATHVARWQQGTSRMLQATHLLQQQRACSGPSLLLGNLQQQQQRAASSIAGTEQRRQASRPNTPSWQHDINIVAAALHSFGAAMQLDQQHLLLQASRLLAAADADASAAVGTDVTPNSNAARSFNSWESSQQVQSQALEAAKLLLPLMQLPSTSAAAEQAAISAWATAQIMASVLQAMQHHQRRQQQASAHRHHQPSSPAQEQGQQLLQQQLQELSSQHDDAVGHLLIQQADAVRDASSSNIILSLPAAASLLHACSTAAQQQGADVLQAAADLGAHHIKALLASSGTSASASQQARELNIMQAGSLVSLLQALAALHLPRQKQHQQLFTAAASILLPLVTKLTAAQRAELLYAYAKARVQAPQLSSTLAALWRALPSSSNAVASSSDRQHSSSSSVEPAAGHPSLLHHAASSTQTHKAQAGLLAHQAWHLPCALAPLPTTPASPAPATTAAEAPASGSLSEEVASLTPRQLSRLAWAATMTRTGSSRLYDVIAEQALVVLSTAARQRHQHRNSSLDGISTRAVGAAGADSTTADSAGSGASRPRPSFQPAELTDLMWALGMARHVARPLCLRAARYIARGAGSFEPGQLALVLWALARLDLPDEVLTQVALQRIVEAAVQQRELLRGAAGAASQGRGQQGLVAPEAAEDPYALLEEGSGGAGAAGRAAAGQGNASSNPFAEDASSSSDAAAGGGARAAAVGATPVLPGWQAVYCLTGLALQRHYDEDALEQLVQLLPMLPPTSLPHVTWALASLNFQGSSASKAFSWLAYRAMEQLAAGAVQRKHVGLLAWSFAAAGLQQPVLWEALSQALAVPTKVLTQAMDRVGLTQLFQVHLAQSSSLAPLLLPECSLQAAQQVYRSWAHTGSYSERSVLECVRSLGHRCEGHHQDEVTGVIVDIAVWVGDEKLAIEVDGPQHFCSNMPQHALGGTVLRDRILRQAGWRVLSVPLHAWRGMQGRRMVQMQRDYMRRHIAAALA